MSTGTGRTAPREPSREAQTAFWGEPRRRILHHQGQVLLVENLRVRRQAICDMLVREHFICGVIEDARDALYLFSDGLFTNRSRMPELIICNARIVGEAGLNALAWLRYRRPDVPLILFSAFTTPKLREGMARIRGARVLDQRFGLADLRTASLSLVTARRKSG